jgi:chemotaxis protein MotB
MLKHKKAESEKEGNSERWLLTYSDMITLLLALFIILYSMSTIDAKKMAKVSENMANALNNGTSTSTKTGTGTNATTGKSGNAAAIGKGSGTGGSGTGIQQDALDEIFSILTDYIDKNNLQNQIGLDNTDSYVRIHLKDVLMFVPDSATMLPASQPVLKEIEQAITQIYGRVDHITFSGNTADVGPHTTAGDQVSWRLSTERAVTVLNSMVGYGLQEDKLSIEGYAHFNPVASNNNEIGRAQNRRVEITIYKYPTSNSTSKTTSSAATSSASGAVKSSANSAANPTASSK